MFFTGKSNCIASGSGSSNRSDSDNLEVLRILDVWQEGPGEHACTVRLMQPGGSTRVDTLWVQDTVNSPRRWEQFWRWCSHGSRTLAASHAGARDPCEVPPAVVVHCPSHTVSSGTDDCVQKSHMALLRCLGCPSRSILTVDGFGEVTANMTSSNVALLREIEATKGRQFLRFQKKVKLENAHQCVQQLPGPGVYVCVGVAREGTMHMFVIDGRVQDAPVVIDSANDAAVKYCVDAMQWIRSYSAIVCVERGVSRKRPAAPLLHVAKKRCDNRRDREEMSRVLERIYGGIYVGQAATGRARDALLCILTKDVSAETPLVPVTVLGRTASHASKVARCQGCGTGLFVISTDVTVFCEGCAPENPGCVLVPVESRRGCSIFSTLFQPSFLFSSPPVSVP